MKAALLTNGPVPKIYGTRANVKRNLESTEMMLMIVQS